MLSTRRAEFVAGVQAELPILVGVAPFGLIYGVLAISAGMPPAPALAMSAILFAGSAQIISTRLFAAGAPGVLMVLTALVVNLRHVLYSASVAPYVQHLPRRWKWLLAYLLTDEAFAVTILHYKRPAPLLHQHWFFLGAGLALWSTWQLSTAAGIFLGASAPESWALDFSLALTFIGLVVPALRDRGAAAAAVTAGITAVLAGGLPLQLGLLAAAAAGIVAGMAVERTK